MTVTLPLARLKSVVSYSPRVLAGVIVFGVVWFIVYDVEAQDTYIRINSNSSSLVDIRVRPRGYSSYGSYRQYPYNSSYRTYVPVIQGPGYWYSVYRSLARKQRMAGKNYRNSIRRQRNQEATKRNRIRIANRTGYDPGGPTMYSD